MSTALIHHPDAAQHITPQGHPERVARIEAVAQVLAAAEFDGLQRHEAPLADESEVLRCHPPEYLERVRKAIPAAGGYQLDADTHVSPGSWRAVMRGVGGTCRAVDLVLGGDARNAFVAMRPPGHHAETSTPMGFCLFGNAAIGAQRALDHHGLKRVAVVDFDVHHGNGTQDLLWDESRALFVSSHQMPLFPGSGAPGERGAHDNILNLPLQPGSGGDEFRAAWESHAFPRLRAFAPELIIVSAGFDGHRADPLANLALVEEDFAWITGALCDIAAEVCEGRVVSVLEGGYDLDALSASVRAHVLMLMDKSQ